MSEEQTPTVTITVEIDGVRFGRVWTVDSVLALKDEGIIGRAVVTFIRREVERKLAANRHRGAHEV